MVLSRQWNIKKWRLLLCMILAILFIGEYFIYFIVATSWNVPAEKSSDDLRVLFISDPQIQGFQFEMFGIFGYITRWDACRYLKKTFLYALSRVQPHVVIVLGDLLDEGYVASDEMFVQYKEWFDDIYTVPKSVKRIHLAGDNDIGGEGEPIETNKLTRHEKYFGPTNEIINFKNWQFVKLNTLSYLRYYRFSNDDERRVYDNLQMFMKSSIQKLDKTKHTAVLSHLPLRYWDPHFALKLFRNRNDTQGKLIMNLHSFSESVSELLEYWRKSRFPPEVLNNINPRVIFSGHDHKAKHRVFNVGEDIFTEENVVSTASYRMGTIDMGIGVAVFGENGTFHYTLLKLPRRYFFLYFYIIVCAISLLYIIFSKKTIRK